MELKTKTFALCVTQEEVNDLEGELFSAGFHEGSEHGRKNLKELTAEEMKKEYPRLIKLRQVLVKYQRALEEE